MRPLNKAPNPPTAPRVLQQYACPLLRVCVHGVCVHYCVCALRWVKCKAQIPSMGHHTWPHITSLTTCIHFSSLLNFYFIFFKRKDDKKASEWYKPLHFKFKFVLLLVRHDQTIYHIQAKDPIIHPFSLYEVCPCFKVHLLIPQWLNEISDLTIKYIKTLTTKRICHWKIKMLSSVTHLHVTFNLDDFLSSVEHKGRHF